MNRLIIGLCWILSTHQLFAQTQDQMRILQLAQSLEQAGEWKQAAELYHRLWTDDTTNYVYFDALRRAYGQLKEYDKSIALIEHRLRFRPQESHLLAALGGLHFDAGRREQADSVWNALLSRNAKMRQLYVLVAQQMTERRLYQRAAEVYHRGRNATGNDADFVEELAMLHSAMQEYGEAVAEYIRLLRAAPHQLGYVQSRIASFTLRQEGLEQAREVVEKASAERPNDIPLLNLLAWVLMEQGDYRGALNATRAIDALSRAGGAELQTFADRAFHGGQFAAAAEAYAELTSRIPHSPIRPAALLGLGRALEQIAVYGSAGAEPAPMGGRVPESTLGPDSALKVYQALMNQHPRSPQALQALYRSGIVLFERFFDLDAALSAFDRVRQSDNAGILVWEASMMSVDVQIARGDLEEAERLLLSIPPPGLKHLGDAYSLKRATLAYLAGKFGEALELLSEVSRLLERDGANDAMELEYLILENRSDSASLSLFALGELLVRRRSFGEAQKAFERVSGAAGTSGLVSRSRLRVADMLVSLGNPREAVTLLDSVVRTMPTDPYRDKAHFLLAQIHEVHLNEPARALGLYQSFLTRHPSSLYAEEARKRVRVLRGDAS